MGATVRNDNLILITEAVNLSGHVDNALAAAVNQHQRRSLSIYLVVHGDVVDLDKATPGFIGTIVLGCRHRGKETKKDP